MNSAPAPLLLARVFVAAFHFAFCISLQSAVAEDSEDETSPAPPTTTLVTRFGDRLPGRWHASDDPGTIAWQGVGFVQPFQFGKESLAAIQVRHLTKAPRLEGSYRCELINGDVLFGTPVAISEEEFILDVADSDPVRIERSRLRKLSPRTPTDEVVRWAPTALSEWKGSTAAWKEADGKITALEDAAELTSTLDLGRKSQIAIHIAWKDQPDFRIDFGSRKKWDRGLRIETWEDQLVFVAESPTAADVILVRDSVARDDELLVNVFIDTHHGTVLLATAEGEQLGEFAWQDEFEDAFRIHARKKGLHFYSATVSPWNGNVPEVRSSDQPFVRYKDGRIDSAVVTAWNPETEEWTLVSSDDATTTEPTQQQVSGSEIEELCFAGEIDQDQDPVQVVSRTGLRLTGEISLAENDRVEVRCRGVEGPIAIPLSNLQSILFLNKSEAESKQPAEFPRLQIGGASLVGQLVDGQGDDHASALVWKPSASRTASAISHEANGTITYREPPIIADKPRQNQVPNPGGLVNGLVHWFGKANPNTQVDTSSSAPLSGPTLHLRTGDSVPCRPLRIDSEGVVFESSVTEATVAPLDKVKALVLIGDFRPAQVTQEERDRLLTTPRMQQEYPPTHLLVSVDGDLLRTRLVAMDDEFITLEVHLNEVKIPRKRVAAIAWLYPEDSEQQLDDESTQNPTGPLLRVQAVRSDGIRLTFQPQEFVGGVLLGKSDVFGDCSVDLSQVDESQVDQLLFGQAITDALTRQDHQLLALKKAVQPRFVSADSSTPSGIGQASSLVGMEAPPVRLKSLDGSDFDLADRRGKVVVLDFWATWCGPCIQWMPQLEEIVANYPADQVELVTINLLQEKDAITPVLERMQIQPTVLLDRDGVVGDAYEATAIPQTVVIDPQGKVARVFIGGSSQIRQPLIDSLEELTKS